MKYLPILFAALLGACSTPQDYGGVTKVSYDREAGTVEYISGKEANAIEVDVTKDENGIISISIGASEVTAFEGQSIQAQRIAEQTAVIASVLQQILPQMLKTGLCAAGMVTACVP